MKIQPIDISQVPAEGTRLHEPVKPVVKSRLKRLFERQFSGVLRSSAAEKITGGDGVPHPDKDDSNNGSVDLSKMVQSFMEENQEKHSAVSARNCRNCFNGNCDDGSDTESNGFGESGYSSSGEAYEILKGLVACASVCERNLLADTTKIVEKNKTVFKRKDDFCRKVVTDGLLSLGYDASICKSRWEKSPFCPAAGEYEYIDVIMGKERVIVDVNFRSEFEIARSTKTYKAILQTLPCVFVGKCDRLQEIIAIVSEAAKQSLKKKGLHVPPWRKTEYVRAKWLSPYTRTTPPTTSFCRCSREVREGTGEKQQVLMGSGEWKPPKLKSKSSQSQGGVKVVTGLAAVFNENP